MQLFALGCLTRELGSSGLVSDMERKLLTRVWLLCSDFSPPTANPIFFTPQTLFSDTCSAPRKQVSVPLIRTQPCGDSAEKPPVECVVCVPEFPVRPDDVEYLSVLTSGDLLVCLPFGRTALHSERRRLRGKPGVAGTVRRLLERWSRRGSGGSLPLFRSMDVILTAS